MRRYSYVEIIKKLSEIGITETMGTLEIPHGIAVGIKTWGMIDFLKMRWIKKHE